MRGFLATTRGGFRSIAISLTRSARRFDPRAHERANTRPGGSGADRRAVRRLDGVERRARAFAGFALGMAGVRRTGPNTLLTAEPHQPFKCSKPAGRLGVRLWRAGGPAD